MDREMTKIDYADKVEKIFSMGDKEMTLALEKLAITGENSILESFHVGDTIRITITTTEEKENEC